MKNLYARINQGELEIRGREKGSPWRYVCHEAEMGGKFISIEDVLSLAARMEKVSHIITSKAFNHAT